MDIAGAQHYVECSLCPKNAQYHCNTCKDNLCEKCKIKHNKSNASRSHVVVLYQARDTSAPEVETCKVHPTLTYEMCCQQCEVPVCSRCIKEKHNGHKFVDTEVFCSEKKNILEEDVKHMKQNSLPKFHLLLEDVKNDAEICRETISKIRSSMTAKANAIKSVVDDILSEELSYLDALESSILSELDRQEETLNKNISNLNNIVDEIEAYLKENKPAKIILMQRESKDQRSREIPGLEKPNFPSFIEGELKTDIIKLLFGKLSLSKTKAKIRNVKEIPVNKKEIKYKLGNQITEVATVSSDVAKTSFNDQIAFQTPDRIWVFKPGKLTQIDMNGEVTKTITIRNTITRCFTFNDQNELLYIDGNNIKKYTEHGNVETVLSVQKWKPLAICFLHFNESLIIVGNPGKYAAVIYDKNKKEMCQGDIDIYPQCVVGNINGDICISQNASLAVEVKDKSLKHRFTYRGGPQQSNFWPFSVCTDVLGHILVCNGWSPNNSVHILDRDGKFISLLLTQQDHGITPTCITTDDKHNVLICDHRKSIKVYKYLE